MMELLTTSIAVGYLLYSMDKFILPSSFKNGFNQLVRCSKCLGFWVTLVVSQDIHFAALVSLVIFLLDSFIVTKL